jgi:glycosyltransferase involved in cell wall biosynthesis
MGFVRELLRPWYLKWLYFRLWPQRRPAGFQECWRFPEPAFAAPADFVFLPMADWHGPRQRLQQLALALAKRGHRCLYLNPHLGREFPQPAPFSRRSAAAQVAPGVTELHVHLWREPVYHHRLLREPEEEQVAGAIAAMIGPGTTVISCFPLWNRVVERLRQSHAVTVVYDCHDLLAGFGNVAPEILEQERAAMEAADVVAFSSLPLAQRWQAPGAVLIRNAGDPEHFRLIPFRLRSGRRPVVGYAGALNHWFDSEAVARAARSRPEWDFVLVGPVDTADVDRLHGLPNVRLAGGVPYEQLPQRLAEFDAVLIPFQLSPLIEAVNPVKLYEYLASGLPVVSARLPEVAAFAEHVYTYGAADELAAAIEAALGEDSQTRREARRAAVTGETWSARADQLEAAISAARSRRRECSRR